MATHGIKTVIYPARDLEKGKAVFAALGLQPASDQPYYVGYEVDGQQIGLDPNGHQEGMTAYWHVDDIAATIHALLGTGAEQLSEPRDVGGGRLIAALRDPNGNLIGLLQDRPQS